MNETLTTILKRRSIRQYQPDQIKEEELQSILEAGKFAPSGMGCQAWHFTAVQNPDALKLINRFAREFMLHCGNPELEEKAKPEDFSALYNAPTLIIISGEEKTRTSQYNCAFALSNMFLAAKSLGIGSCFIFAAGASLNDNEEGKAVMKALGVPDGYRVYAAGAFGYPAGELPEAAPRKEGTVNIVK